MKGIQPRKQMAMGGKPSVTKTPKASKGASGIKFGSSKSVKSKGNMYC